MKLSRTLLLPLLLLIAAGALLYNLYQQSHVIPARSSSVQTPRYTLDDVNWTRFNQLGQPTLQGQASRVDYYADDHAVATDLQLSARRPHGTPWTASAPSALMPAGEKRVRLDGNVVVHGQWPDNAQALEIDTTRLWVDPDTHELYTDADVILRSHGRNGNATGLRADWLTQTVNLYADVRMSYEQTTH